MELFHFIRPYWLLLMIPVGFILLLFWKSSNKDKVWSGIIDKHLIQHVVINNKIKIHIFPFIFALILWTIAIIALAGPTWSYKDQPTYNKKQARVIALDVSNSMNASDILPTRLKKAKYKITDLLRQIKEGETGMVVFSKDAFVVSPLTSDTNTLLNFLPSITTDVVPVQGEDIAKALDKSAQMIHQSGFQSGEIILITDSLPLKAANDAAKKLAKDNIKVNVWAVGSEKGGPILDNDGNYFKNSNGDILFSNINMSALRKLAQYGDGHFVEMKNNNESLKYLLDYTAQKQANFKKEKRINGKIWLDQGHWFIWILLLLLAVVARKNWIHGL